MSAKITVITDIIKRILYGIFVIALTGTKTGDANTKKDITVEMMHDKNRVR